MATLLKVLDVFLKYLHLVTKKLFLLKQQCKFYQKKGRNKDVSFCQESFLTFKTKSLLSVFVLKKPEIDFFQIDFFKSVIRETILTSVFY